MRWMKRASRFTMNPTICSIPSASLITPPSPSKESGDGKQGDRRRTARRSAQKAGEAISQAAGNRQLEYTPRSGSGKARTQESESIRKYIRKPRFSHPQNLFCFNLLTFDSRRKIAQKMEKISAFRAAFSGHDEDGSRRNTKIVRGIRDMFWHDFLF